MIAAAASHNCVTLIYMSWLTYFGICHCFFEAKYLVLMDTFKARELILGQIEYTSKCSGCNLPMQPPVFLTSIHGPVILPYISNILLNGLTLYQV